MKRLCILFSMCLLSGCAGMKSSFDCNATAQDSCMTMEEANKKAQSQSLSAPGAKKSVPAQPEAVRLPAQARNDNVETGSPAGTLTPRPAPVMTTAQTVKSGTAVSPQPVTGRTSGTVNRAGSVSALNDTGITQAVYQPAPTARVWIAGWIDEHDNFYQPSVVSFVVKRGQWAEYQ